MPIDAQNPHVGRTLSHFVFLDLHTWHAFRLLLRGYRGSVTGWLPAGRFLCFPLSALDRDEISVAWCSDMAKKRSVEQGGPDELSDIGGEIAGEARPCRR